MLCIVFFLAGLLSVMTLTSGPSVGPNTKSRRQDLCRAGKHAIPRQHCQTHTTSHTKILERSSAEVSETTVCRIAIRGIKSPFDRYISVIRVANVLHDYDAIASLPNVNIAIIFAKLNSGCLKVLSKLGYTVHCTRLYVQGAIRTAAVYYK